MKKYLWLTLSFAVLLGWMATQAEARGGGHGGGGHGGGGGHHKAGEHPNKHGKPGEHSGKHKAPSHHHANQHHHSHVPSHFGPNHRPFTPGWYGNHPNAWGSGNVNNYWAPATFGAAAAWLGYTAGAAANSGSSESDTTVYTGDTNPDLNNPAVEDPESSTEPTTDSANSSAADAAELAARGKTESTNHADFLPLGVYSLAPGNQQESSAMLQLAVNKEGVLRGSYYDVLSDQEHPIQGSIDQATQRVAWTVVPNTKVVFEASLQDLTQESGPVSVHFENGKTRQWTLARYDGDESKDEPKDESKDEPSQSANEELNEDSNPEANQELPENTHQGF